MINGGTATMYVSDMDRAVRFYTETLGLKLLDRYEEYWATIQVGNSLILSLHPASPAGPAAGTSGSISVGLNVTLPLEEVMATLTSRGVQFRGPIQGDPKAPIRLAFFGDPDGNDLYLCETRKSWPTTSTPPKKRTTRPKIAPKEG